MKTKQTVLGALVIVTGIVVFLANINAGATRAIIESWWPLALIVVGAYMLWANAKSFVWPLIVMAAGVLALLKTHHVADISLGTLFVPLILLGIGTSIIISSLNSTRKQAPKSEDNITAILGGSSSRNTSNNYTGGTVTTIMGGAELDLSRAVIKHEAVLSVSIIMGGLELRLAENVRVVNRTQSFFGGIEDKTRPTNGASHPTLIVDGPIFMGGVEIKR